MKMDSKNPKHTIIFFLLFFNLQKLYLQKKVNGGKIHWPTKTFVESEKSMVFIVVMIIVCGSYFSLSNFIFIFLQNPFYTLYEISLLD